MKLFNVHIVESGEELGVVARTTDHAAEVFVTFRLARTGSAPGEFSIGRGAPVSYQDDIMVRHVAGGDVAGVLIRQPDGSLLFDAAIC